MKKISFILILLTIFFFTVKAQTGYCVIYSYDKIYTSFTVNGERLRLPVITDKLVFRDSLSFYYRVPMLQKDPLKKAKVFGDKLINHGILYNVNKNYYYNQVAWPKGKPEYLVKDSVKVGNWIFLAGSKQILGYTCKAALRINEKNDSTLVWYTESIPKPFGPYIYVGFSGLVLEVIDQATSWHLVATKIKEGLFDVVLPKKGIIISREDFIRLRH